MTIEWTNMPTPKTAKRVTDDRDRALYVISVAAELTGVHPQTLRMYERKGLLKPKRTEGRARRYSEREVEYVRLIQELTQEHGVNLAGVAMVMELTRALDEVQAQVEHMRAEAEALRAEIDSRNEPLGRDLEER